MTHLVPSALCCSVSALHFPDITRQSNCEVLWTLSFDWSAMVGGSSSVISDCSLPAVVRFIPLFALNVEPFLSSAAWYALKQSTRPVPFQRLLQVQLGNTTMCLDSEDMSPLQYPTIHCVPQHCVMVYLGNSCGQEMSHGHVILQRYLHSSGNQSQANI